jgi:hypothetical protein
MNYKDTVLKNLFETVPAERYHQYEKIEDDIRDIMGHIPKDEMGEADKHVLIHEYQEYFIKKYVPVRADTKERFYVSQLIRWVMAQLKEEIV